MAQQAQQHGAQQIFPRSYGSTLVTFTGDAWFNATAVASRYGKRPVDWLNLPDTKRYIGALCEHLRSEKKSLLSVKRSGRGKSDATWFHPKLAVRFAQWLDVRFAIWCDEQIDGILRDRIVNESIRTAEYLPTYHTLHDQMGLLATGSSNARFVHMNINKLVNRTIGIGAGERGRLCMPQRSLLVVAQSVASAAMRNAADHHDGYTRMKEALRRLEIAAIGVNHVE